MHENWRQFVKLPNVKKGVRATSISNILSIVSGAGKKILWILQIKKKDYGDAINTKTVI